MNLPTTPPEDELGKFGKLVVERKFASLPKVKAVIQHQRKLLLKGKKIRLGDLMVKLGLITPEQQKEILNTQNSVKSPIPGYEILEKLGQGGMGAVYRGRQINMDRMVAIKTLNQQLAAKKEYVDKFLKEAKSVAKLNHNNIVKGIDVGQNKGRYFFIMEYVDGPTIQEKLNKEGIFDEKSALQIVLQIADAIRYIQQHGIVHRDIKPDNIILTKQGTPKLADLGLVLTKDETGINHPIPTNTTIDKDDSNTTGINTNFVGTPHYISPEQAQEKHIDFRSDIYSLGATLFHMVTGRTPFTGDRSIIIMTKHITEELDNPLDLNPTISKGLCNLIYKMMEKEPDGRQNSPEELMQDINTVIETGELNTGNKPKSKSKKLKKRSTYGGRRRKRRLVRKPGSAKKRSSKSRRIEPESSPHMDVTTDSFLMDPSELGEEEYSCQELLKLAKETNDFKLKEKYLAEAMSDESEENDIYTLEAKCRLAYLISVIRKEEAIELLLEVIEDYIEYSDNKYYGLAEQKLNELNHS